MLLVALQAIPKDNSTLIVGAVSSVIMLGGVVANAVIQKTITSNAASRIEGAVSARLDNHDRDIERIKDEQGNQWKDINKNAADIKGLQQSCRILQNVKAARSNG